MQSQAQPITTTLLNKTGSKFTIGDKVYCFNLNFQHPLVNEFTIKGIINNDDGLYYTADRSIWIKEEYLYKTRKDCYKKLIEQAENEMNSPDNLNK